MKIMMKAGYDLRYVKVKNDLSLSKKTNTPVSPPPPRKEKTNRFKYKCRSILIQIMEGLTMEAKNSISNLFTSSTVLLPEQKMKESEIRIQHGSEYA